MKTRLLQLLLASAFLFSHSKTAMGQNSVWMMHSGITNPTNESFRLFQGEGATVGPVFSDFGIDTWATHQTEGGIFAVVYYQQLMTPQQHLEIIASDWTLTVTARQVQNNIQSGVNFFTGSEYFSFGFGNLPIGAYFRLTGADSKSSILRGEGFSYHTYEIRYSLATDTADLYVDGTQRIGSVTGQKFPDGSGYGALTWGQLGSGSGQANWNLVSLTVVPEPSSVLLLLAGSGLAWCCRKRGFK